MDGARLQVKEASESFQRQRMKWEGIIESLGKEFSCPLPEVERMLSAIAYQLDQEAQVKDFIPVLAVKQVKDLLRKSRYIASGYALTPQTYSATSSYLNNSRSVDSSHRGP